MAIKFLHNISLENLELKNAKLDVVSSDPNLQGADYEGRVIYNSTDNAIKYHNGGSSNQWITLNGSGDISSVTVSAGTGLEVEAGADSASSGDFSVTLGIADISGVSGTYGSATEIPRITVNGQGQVTGVTTNSVSSYSGWSITDGSTTEAIASGNTLTVSATDEIEVAVSSTDTLTIGHADVSRTNTTGSALSPGYGGSFNVITGITSNDRGHITEVTTQSVTIPSSDNVNTTYDLRVEAGGTNSAVLKLDASSGDDDTVTFTGDDDAITITEVTTVESEEIIFTLKDTIGGARTFSGNVTVSGNLTVNGTTTTVNSNTVSVGDNIIVLNSDETGTPSQNAGIEVERGTSTNVSLLFDEGTDRWKFTGNGSTFYNIPITGEFNPTLGTNSDIDYDGATVVSTISFTNGVVTAFESRDLTLADLGYTGSTTADNYGGWNLKLDGNDTSEGASVASGEAVEFLSTTSEHGGVTITNPGSANQLEFNVVTGTTTKRGALELATNNETTTGTDTSRAVTPAGVAAALAATGFAVDLDASESAVTKSSNTYTVTHGLASQDLIVQVVDISAGTPTFDTVHVDITRPNTSTIKVEFAGSVTDDDYRVLITKVM